MTTKYTSDWCQGFCRTCGTGCGEYCEQIKELQEAIAKLEALLEGYQKPVPEAGTTVCSHDVEK